MMQCHVIAKEYPINKEGPNGWGDFSFKSNFKTSRRKIFTTCSVPTIETLLKNVCGLASITSPDYDFD